MALIEVYILDAQAYAFNQAQTGAIEKLYHEPVHAAHQVEYDSSLLFREYCG